MSETSVPSARLQMVDRAQAVLRPVVVEELIAEDHPARAIWAFVGRLDLSGYVEQVRAVEGHAGRPAWDPQVLVSLWVYSYSRGVSSARAIAELCDRDPAYQWLTGMAPISGHTLSDFRVAHAETLHELFVQVLGLLSAEGLITLERVMQDGTRVRAASAPGRFRSQPRIERFLQHARDTVDALETLAEDEATRRQQRARARAAREQQARLAAALDQFAALARAKSRVTRVSTTDPEARLMRQPEGGAAPSYNVQVGTDAAQKLIVAIDVTQAGTDYGQLSSAVDRIEQNLGRQPVQVVVDAGYLSNDNIVAMAERGVDLIGPDADVAAARHSRQIAYQSRQVQPDYEADHFQYDAATDTYVCPQGKRLTYDAKDPRKGQIRYRYKAAAADCASCPAKPQCCPRTRAGRSIHMTTPLPALVAFRARMQTDEARAIYRTRSQVAEFPNLWIKCKFGLRQFRVRGLAKVRMECVWAALTYNIQQWLRLRRPVPPILLPMRA